MQLDNKLYLLRMRNVGHAAPISPNLTKINLKKNFISLFSNESFRTIKTLIV